MLCRNCNNETLDGAAFCTQCGTPMLHSCPSCQSGNPQGSAYCYACGAGLLAQTQQQPETPSRPPEAYWIEEAYRGEEPFEAEEPSRPGPAASGGAVPDVQRSGFWNRFVGLLIDVGILIFPSMLIVMILADEGNFFLSLAYFAGFWAVWGATPGKRLLGMSIERPDGSRIGPGRAVARYFAAFLSMLLLGVGFVMIGLRADKRGLHDLICDTVVVQREPASLSKMVNEVWSGVRSLARN